MSIYKDFVVVNNPQLLISGQTPQKNGLIPETIEEQIDVVLQKIEDIIKENNTELNNIVKMNVYITDRSYLSAIRERFTLKLKDIKPAMTLVVVSGLIDPLFKVEVDATVTL